MISHPVQQKEKISINIWGPKIDSQVIDFFRSILFTNRTFSYEDFLTLYDFFKNGWILSEIVRRYFQDQLQEMFPTTTTSEPNTLESIQQHFQPLIIKPSSTHFPKVPIEKSLKSTDVVGTDLTSNKQIVENFLSTTTTTLSKGVSILNQMWTSYKSSMIWMNFLLMIF